MRGWCIFERMEDLGVLGFDTIALINVEDVVIAKEGDLLLFVRLLVFLFDEFPENEHGRLLALLHFTAFGLTLLEG